MRRASSHPAQLDTRRCAWWRAQVLGRPSLALKNPGRCGGRCRLHGARVRTSAARARPHASSLGPGGDGARRTPRTGRADREPGPAGQLPHSGPTHTLDCCTAGRPIRLGASEASGHKGIRKMRGVKRMAVSRVKRFTLTRSPCENNWPICFSLAFGSCPITPMGAAASLESDLDSRLARVYTQQR